MRRVARISALVSARSRQALRVAKGVATPVKTLARSWHGVACTGPLRTVQSRQVQAPRSAAPLARRHAAHQAVRQASLVRLAPTARCLSSSSSSGQARGVEVPIIDVSAYFAAQEGKGSPEAAQAVVDQMRHACENVGFLGIVGHNVPIPLIRAMEFTTRQYFDRSEEEKNEILMDEEYPYGYNGFQKESLGAGYGEKPLLDLKECFAIGPNNPDAGMPPVRWPSQPPSFEFVWSEYYKAMEKLSSDVLSMFAQSLDLPKDFFDDKVTHHRSALRALNYPESTPNVDSDPAHNIRAGAHTDYGTLTILLQDPVGGLQVQDGDRWVDVPYAPNSYVINIGDLMQRWTNDTWRSTVHRVVVRHPRRQSIAFFHNVNADLTVEVLPQCVPKGEQPKYPPVNSWEHLLEKHWASIKGY